MTSLPPDDEDPSLRLVALIQAGIDPEGNFERLYKMYVNIVRSFFLKRGLRPDQAEDLTQEVFLRVYKGIRSFRRDSRFGTWLFKIAAHLWQNDHRWWNTGRRSAVEESLDKPAEDGHPLQVSSASPSPLDNLLKQEQDQELSEAVERLPPKMRQCFLLRYRHGLKYEEIAEIMGISVQTVKPQIYQAKKRLKLDLSDDPEE